MPKVLLVNDTRNWYHFGCHATSSMLVEMIERSGHTVSTIPTKTIYAIGDNNKLVPHTVNKFDDDLIYQEFAKNHQKLIQLIKNNDMIVINGEGTLHGLNPAPVFLLYVAYITKIRLGKHVEIINHSAYPEHGTTFSDTQEAAIYRLVYSVIDFIAIRESLSFETMHRLLDQTIKPKSKLTKSFDCLPLYIRDHYFNSRKIIKKKTDQILISGSALWAQIKNMLSTTPGNIAQFERTLTMFSDYLKEKKKQGFMLVFLTSKIKNSSKDDLNFIQYMNEKCGVKIAVYKAQSLDNWLKAVEESALLVSGRFHHTIAAICLGTPFIAFDSNTPKVRSMVMEVEAKGTFLEHSSATFFENLLNDTERLLKISPEIANIPQSSSFFDSLCAKAEKNFDMLKTLHV